MNLHKECSESEQNCIFCKEIQGVFSSHQDEGYRNLISKRKNIILETKNFVMFPDYSGVAIGHAIIVTKEHVLSYARISEEKMEEFFSLLNFICEVVKDKTKRRIECFEHGSIESLEENMSSITHAHIHLMPRMTPLDIKKLEIAFDIFDFRSMYSSKELSKKGYLLFKSMDDKWYVSQKGMVVSQYFRKIYAKEEKNPQLGDWKKKRTDKYLNVTLEFYEKIFRDLKITQYNIKYLQSKYGLQICK